jgi:hypothetical protein
LEVIAFRIWDFKSVTDSGECHLSADNITVLAGQNESGKTAILQALRDFDLEEGEKPAIPGSIENRIFQDGYLWITRDLPTGKFELDADLQELWNNAPETPGPQAASEASPDAAEKSKEVISLTPGDFPGSSRLLWPLFVYFDSFEDTLPRTVDVSLIQTSAEKSQAQAFDRYRVKSTPCRQSRKLPCSLY